MTSFQTAMFSYLVFFPAAILCFLPMRNQLRFGKAFSLIAMLSIVGMLSVFGGMIESSVKDGQDVFFYPFMLLCFLTYHSLIKTHIVKSLSVFTFVSAIVSFISNYSNGVLAMVHPEGFISNPTLEGLAVQLMMFSLATFLLAYPFSSAGSWLVDNLDILNVWFVTIIMSGIFVTFNIMLYPRQNSILQIPEVSKWYWGSLGAMFMLLMMLMILFYFIVKGIVDKSAAEDRNKVFEMEESQFLKQQAYMKDSQQARHDFKHAIRTLNELCEAEDYEAVSNFVSKYAESMPQNDITIYSNNNAVNAMMNYYAQSAYQNDIKISWVAAIPENLPLSDVELCNIIGNILENAITACTEMEGGERWIQFTAETQNDSQFLIVASNSFSGKVRKRKGQYLSIHRMSNGIGLSSIARIAESYGGNAEFSHQDKEFYTNVIIPIRQNGQKQSED